MGRTVALALGGGGARGLAHIPVLEAFDELGVRPVALAGTSMGAIFAAAYASGLCAADIREYTRQTLEDKRGLRSKLLTIRTGSLTDLFSRTGHPAMVDGEAFCNLFLPSQVVDDFADCLIPLTVVATDYYGRCDRAISSGPLKTAVAASMALPGLVRPVVIDGQILIDGGATNPLPIEYISGKADIIVGIDVAGASSPGTQHEVPGAWETMFGALQIMQATIVDQKAARYLPDILIRPDVGSFRALDFAQSSVIFRLAKPAKEQLKRQLAAALEQQDSAI